MKKTIDQKKQRVSKEVQPSGFITKIPVTGDKPRYHQATANVYVEGLSVLCPNEQKKSVEIAFVKPEHSGVEIRVYKSGCRKVFSRDLNKEEKVKIEIGKSVAKEMGSLYMDAKKYDDDFGWMPDLNRSDWHPEDRIEIRPGAKNYLSAKLVLKDAQFYTHLKSENVGLLKQNGTDAEKEIGRIGRVLGASIVCDDNDKGIHLKIESDSGTVVNEFFSKSEGPFYISVVTRPDSYESHLHHIYHHIVKKTPQQPEYDFRYKDSEKEWFLCEPPPPRITTFACQTFPGGDGPLPDFP